uniref:Uncharacterized protein n=1 Tax=Aegilops tauschii subsp. strangulata TaxID=200361 RepID=A0A453CRC6_AEGTS
MRGLIEGTQRLQIDEPIFSYHEEDLFCSICFEATQHRRLSKE